jgi:hypothetical protein
MVENTPEETPTGTESFWRGSLRTGWNEAIRWGVVGVLGLVAAVCGAVYGDAENVITNVPARTPGAA